MIAPIDLSTDDDVIHTNRVMLCSLRDCLIARGVITAEEFIEAAKNIERDFQEAVQEQKEDDTEKN